MQSVFEFDDYKKFLLTRIEEFPNQGRGIRGKMAEAMGCQVAYVSHVLAGDRHFSLEQGEVLTRFLELRTDEAEYFLLLIEHNRAGTASLRKLLNGQLDRRREQYRQLKGRVKLKSAISGEDQARYYSSWHYQAVRMLLTIPEYRTPRAIAQKLSLPRDRVNDILSFFVSLGLAKEHQGTYSTTETQIHLGSDSPLISRLHTNWRLHAMQSLDRSNPEDLHYSGAVTLSHKDFQTVREILVKGLLQSLEVIKPSKEERLCVLAMDFYEV